MDKQPVTDHDIFALALKWGLTGLDEPSDKHFLLITVENGYSDDDDNIRFFNWFFKRNNRKYFLSEFSLKFLLKEWLTWCKENE